MVNRSAGMRRESEFDRAARHWSFEGGYEVVSPTFRADNGFVRQNNDQTAYIWQGVTIYPEKVLPFVERIRPNMVMGSSWNFDRLQKRFLLPSIRFHSIQEANEYSN